MVLWEHKIEFVSLMQTSSLQAQAKMSDAAYDKVQARCTELGAQGWELVSLAPMATVAGPSATHLVAAFKRPKG
jgi:hypothetical protein